MPKIPEQWHLGYKAPADMLLTLFVTSSVKPTACSENLAMR